MARLPDLIEFAREHGLKIGTIADMIQYRSRNEALVSRASSKPVRTAHGEFTLHAYADHVADEVHLVLTFGQFDDGGDALVRVHEPVSVLDFLDPDSGRHTFSIDAACAAIARFGRGAIVLLHRPESGQDLLAGLGNSRPTGAKKWDPRLYGIGAQILRDLGIRKMRLLASPRRMPSMTGFDLEVTGYVATPGDAEKL
jgi:3,4-dihydroxy 2-butanone 4-phosphate synthase/GTP cyclohydrolase II